MTKTQPGQPGNELWKTGLYVNGQVLTSWEALGWSGPHYTWDRFPGWELIPKEGRGQDGNVPPYSVMYRAFELVKPEDVRVVILGQDPYPTRGHANGLAFSVNPHVKRLPASLANIFREYSSDLGYPTPRNGDLTSWAHNGVLLLNTALTTEEGKRGSHIKQWAEFTKRMVRWLSRLPGRRVFILWGRQAQAYKELIGESNTVIVSSHPSPLSASSGFFGSKPFSRASEALGTSTEMWRLE